MRPIIIVRMIVILSAVIGIFVASKILYEKSQRDNSLPFYATVTDFDFVTQDSVPFGLKNLQGKISVVDFMFTRCLGPCPIMTNHMGELYVQFKTQPTIQFVSISVDPEFDTLLALQQYAAAQGVNDNKWLFLSAPMDNVKSLCENGFKLSAEALPGAHSTKFILVDTDGVIRGYYSGIEKESMLKLQKDIERLL